MPLLQTEQMARFAARADYEDLSERARGRLKLHLLDTLGCAIGALDSIPIAAIRDQVVEFAAPGRCTLIAGGRMSPDRAALWNGALLRYLDFMDNYLAPMQTGHPSDNFASVLAAAEYADASGRDFLAALALAYQTFTRLLEEAPVQSHGFDHTVQLAYSMAMGAVRAMKMKADQAAHALAIAGASNQGMVVTRSGYLSQWKGLQSASIASSVMNAVFIAKRGVTGPLQVLDGKEGFPKAFGVKVQIDWAAESLEQILRCSLKSYNAEVHTQPAIEAMLQLRKEHHPRADEIESIDVEIFKQAYDITGAGEEAGDKYDVRSKEQADHSLPYLLAVALLDGEVTPRQFTPDRIERRDVQRLLRKVRTLRDDMLSRRYPSETPCRIVVELSGGKQVNCEKTDWHGFYKRPLSWNDVRQKFDALAEPFAEGALRSEIADAVANLEVLSVRDLTRLLERVHVPAARGQTRRARPAASKTRKAA